MHAAHGRCNYHGRLARVRERTRHTRHDVSAYPRSRQQGLFVDGVKPRAPVAGHLAGNLESLEDAGQHERFRARTVVDVVARVPGRVASSGVDDEKAVSSRRVFRVDESPWQ